MIEILTDLGVIVGCLVVVACCAAAMVFGRPGIPAFAIAIVGVAAGWAVKGFELDSSYRELPSGDRGWMLVVASVAFAIVGSTAVWARGRDDRAVDLTLVLALASGGLFLCIPETDLLRLVVGPLVLVATVALFGRLRPFNPIEASMVGAGLTWLLLTQGASRGSAIIGAAACLAAVGLLVLGGRFLTLVIISVAIALLSRFAGLLESTGASAVSAAVILAAAVVAIRSASGLTGIVGRRVGPS